MGAVNLKKDYGWGNVFFKTGDAATLPEQLTPKWWSKQKQVLAAGKETGIGGALEELQKLFKAVRFPSVMGRQDTRDHDIKLCEEAIDSSQLKAFVKQLGAVQKLAKEHAGDFKGVTKKTGEALAEIGEVAAEVAQVCGDEYLRSCLQAALNEAVDKKFEKIVENAALVIEARNGVLKKLPAALENIKDLLNRYSLDKKPATGQLIGGALTSYCRDMTQVIFNMLKLDEGGFELDGFNSVKASNVNDRLIKWADVKTSITYDTPQAAIADVKAVGELTKEYILIVKDVKMPKK